MQTVIGLFENAAKAQQAAEELKNNGFTSDNIDVSSRKEATNTFKNYDSEQAPISIYQDNLSSDTSSNASTTGTLNYPAGYATGGTSANSVNPAALDDHGEDRNEESFGDKVAKFFSHLFGGDDDQADRYSKAATTTGNVVTVHAKDGEEAERAADILDDYGAIDVNESTAGYGTSNGTDVSSDSENSIASYPFDGPDASSFKEAGMSPSDGTGISSPSSTDDTTDENNKLDLKREDMQIGKKDLETGGIRLRSKIVERPVEEQFRLKEEGS